jgi:BMFP domain-containing protein YqiC
MQTRNPWLDDLARVGAGLAGAIGSLREELEARMKDRFERMLSNMQLVTREEFEAVRELARKARAAQEELEARIARLESGGAGRKAAAKKKPQARPRMGARKGRK